MRIEMFGDEIERLMTLHPVTGEILTEDQELYVFPATHYVAGPGADGARASAGIEAELEERLAELERQGKLLEAQRLRMRTDLRHRDDAPGRLLLGHRELLPAHRRPRGRARRRNCLLDYFPEDFLLVIDESHVTVPQIGGMYEGDMSRKRTLVEHGFRLPSAMDNRPLRGRSSSSGSARPSTCRRRRAPTSWPRVDGDVVEQVIRPTGLVDPEIIVKPTKGQIDDLIARDPAAHRARRAGPGHDADQEDVRGPHRLPARAGHPGALPALRGRHAAPHRAAARAAARACSTSWSASTCCARASTCPRCRWWRSSTPTRRGSCARARR